MSIRMMPIVFQKHPEKVNWELVDAVFKEFEIEINMYQDIMKEVYGDFYGDDWKIAVADLILKIGGRVDVSTK